MADLRGDRGFTMDEVFPAFRAAAGWNVAVVRGIGPQQWELPGLGEWTVLELAAHASRAYTTIEQYLRPAGGVIDIASAADYFRLGLAAPDINAQVAQRARDEVELLGDDPVAAIAARADSAVAAVERAAPGTVAETFVGTLALADYLATRVVEVTVHTLDLCAALGRDDEPPDGAGRVSLQVVAAIAAGHSQGLLLRALTGRGGLPQGFSAFP